MNKYYLLLILVLLVLGCTQPGNTARVCINSNCFDCSIASTPVLRAQGLMGVEQLPVNQGMLFVFEQSGVYPFWMKNTMIPLDIIWVDENNTIVYINANTPPCDSDPCPSYNPDTNALYVIEINEGLSEEYGISVGDRIIIYYT